MNSKVSSWYITSDALHRNLRVNVEKTIAQAALSDIQRLHRHCDPEAIQLLDSSIVVTRLNRLKSLDYCLSYLLR